MSFLSTRARRAGLALAAAVVAAPVLPLSHAAEAAPAAPTAAAAGVTQLTPAVTAEAWQAGRAKMGLRASADAAVAAYWTPERMRAARPVEESAQYAKAAAVPQQGLKAGLTLAGSAKQLLVPPAHGTIKAPANRPMATDPNLNASHPTARTAGKVFFSRDGGNWVCSGTVVNSAGLNTVWTAGHCIHGGKGGTLASNWTFVPAYNADLANPRPYGTWTAVGLWIRTAWMTDSNFAEDMGVAIMGILNGQHIVGLLGGQGLWTNAGTNQFMNAFGYPQEAPFDGRRLKQCAAWSTQEVPSVWTQTLKITPCNFTGGSSGGSWLLNYDGQWGLVNGLNSRADRATFVASPYFDDTAGSLYEFTKNF
jgi:V8-like Glu-specific endopeptidase